MDATHRSHQLRDRLRDLEKAVDHLSADLTHGASTDATQNELLSEIRREQQRSRRQRLIDSGAAIALAAFLFSLVAFFIDSSRAGRQQELDARAELS